MKKVLFILLLLCVAACGYSYVSLNAEVAIPGSTESISVEIPDGASVDDAVAVMQETGLVEDVWVVRLYAKLYAHNTKKHIHKGTFAIHEDMKVYEAVEFFFEPGVAQTINITIPEGLSLLRMVPVVAAAMNLPQDSVSDVLLSKKLAAKVGATTHLEGYLLPETYNVYAFDGVEQLAQRMYDSHSRFWDEIKEAAKKVNLTQHQVITLASIIEAETPVPDEMPRVSGVYHNRLKSGMLLQADPTVQYALGDVKKRLTYDDLEIDNPYNTYRFAGLPPGPINNPGKAALRAAVNPEQHKFYYFVARGDGTNLHTFSRTNVEHNRAVQQYRLNRNR